MARVDALVGCLALASVALACGDGITSPAAPTPSLADASAAPESDAAAPVDAASLEADSAIDAGVEAGPPLDVPASLVAALGGKTYVEDSCVPATYPGWPYPALTCTYRTSLVVTIANPPPDRVARWIVEASTRIPALDRFHQTDRPSWEKGLLLIAQHTIGQSSRIFPLAGDVWENGTTYKFERGVTKTCSSGCYCRINSMSRPAYCKYAAEVLGTETESACLAKYGQTTNTLTDPWLAHCFDNHLRSFMSDQNEHYRAHAHDANKRLFAALPTAMTATANEVLTALGAIY